MELLAKPLAELLAPELLFLSGGSYNPNQRCAGRPTPREIEAEVGEARFVAVPALMLIVVEPETVGDLAEAVRCSTPAAYREPTIRWYLHVR